LERDGPEHDHHGDDHHDDHEDHSHGFDWPEAARIAFVALAAVAVWFKLWEPFSAVSVIGVVGLVVGGWSILKEAFENTLERRMTMELSMTIAIVAVPLKLSALSAFRLLFHEDQVNLVCNPSPRSDRSVPGAGLLCGGATDAASLARSRKSIEPPRMAGCFGSRHRIAPRLLGSPSKETPGPITRANSRFAFAVSASRRLCSLP
jgi:hypothetical protein